MSDEEGKGFKVTDRRSVKEAGDEAPAKAAKQPAEEGGDEARPADAGEEADGGNGGGADEPEEEADGEQFPMNFATFVISMGESAFVHLGAVPNPMTGETHKDLTLARQTIDILGILEEKTAGNLSREEEKLLKNLLYTLRMQYVQAGQG